MKRRLGRYELGVTLFSSDLEQLSVLHYAIMNFNEAMVHVLLNAGADARVGLNVCLVS